MIDHRHKAIFFHTPRTAGTSTEVFLLGFRPDGYRCVRDSFYGWDSQERLFLQHATCQYVQRHIISASMFRRYFKFAVVRNPYSRLLSAYHYHNAWAAERSTFRDFVLALPRRCQDPRTQDGTHDSPQHLFTHIDGKQVVDHILRFENIAQEMALVAERLKIQRPFPHLNSGVSTWKKVAPESHYDPVMREIVSDLYSRDFELFHYPS